MQRCLSLIFATIVLVCNALSCSSVTFDGKLNNSEWENSEIFILENPEGFNNSVKTAYLHLKSDLDKNQLYLCITMNLKEFDNPLVSSVRLTLNNGEEVRVCADGSCLFNKDDYGVEHGMTYNTDSKDIVFEVMLGVKNGIPERNKLSVVLVDSHQMPSNKFDIELNFDESQDVSSVSNKVTRKKSTVKETKTNKTVDTFTFEKATVNTQNQVSAYESQKSVISELSSDVEVINGADENKKLITVTGVVCAAAIVASSIFATIKRTRQSDKEQDE